MEKKNPLNRKMKTKQTSTPLNETDARNSLPPFKNVSVVGATSKNKRRKISCSSIESITFFESNIQKMKSKASDIPLKSGSPLKKHCIQNQRRDSPFLSSRCSIRFKESLEVSKRLKYSESNNAIEISNCPREQSFSSKGESSSLNAKKCQSLYSGTKFKCYEEGENLNGTTTSTMANFDASTTELDDSLALDSSSKVTDISSTIETLRTTENDLTASSYLMMSISDGKSFVSAEAENNNSFESSSLNERSADLLVDSCDVSLKRKESCGKKLSVIPWNCLKNTDRSETAVDAASKRSKACLSNVCKNTDSVSKYDSIFREKSRQHNEMSPTYLKDLIADKPARVESNMTVHAIKPNVSINDNCKSIDLNQNDLKSKLEEIMENNKSSAILENHIKDSTNAVKDNVGTLTVCLSEDFNGLCNEKTEYFKFCKNVGNIRKKESKYISNSALQVKVANTTNIVSTSSLIEESLSPSNRTMKVQRSTYKKHKNLNSNSKNDFRVDNRNGILKKTNSFPATSTPFVSPQIGVQKLPSAFKEMSPLKERRKDNDTGDYTIDDILIVGIKATKTYGKSAKVSQKKNESGQWENFCKGIRREPNKDKNSDVYEFCHISPASGNLSPIFSSPLQLSNQIPVDDIALMHYESSRKIISGMANKGRNKLKKTSGKKWYETPKLQNLAKHFEEISEWSFCIEKVEKKQK